MSKDKDICQVYISEIESFLNSYNPTIEQRINIINIFESYIRATISTAIESSKFGIINCGFEATASNCTANFKRKIDQLLSCKTHIMLLEFILSHRLYDITFNFLDERDLYEKIINGTFNAEVYCLSQSSYENLCAILYSIANKLGLNSILNEKAKELNIYTDQDKAYESLREAIKGVEL